MRVALILAVISAYASCASAQDINAIAKTDIDPSYSVRPSDVQVPDGVAFGKYRRVITPYKNWTLNCDENLKSRKKICNISQIIVDSNDAVVFSWSLVATSQGKPVMMLRVPPAVGSGRQIKLTFAGRNEAISVDIKQCDQSVCIGLLPMGQIMQEEIGKASTPTISFAMGNLVKVPAPLDGLLSALSGIN